jgi:hypothetical protein
MVPSPAYLLFEVLAPARRVCLASKAMSSHVTRRIFDKCRSDRVRQLMRRIVGILPPYSRLRWSTIKFEWHECCLTRPLYPAS